MGKLVTQDDIITIVRDLQKKEKPLSQQMVAMTFYT